MPQRGVSFKCKIAGVSARFCRTRYRLLGLSPAPNAAAYSQLKIAGSIGTSENLPLSLSPAKKMATEPLRQITSRVERPPEFFCSIKQPISEFEYSLFRAKLSATFPQFPRAFSLSVRELPNPARTRKTSRVLRESSPCPTGNHLRNGTVRVTIDIRDIKKKKMKQTSHESRSRGTIPKLQKSKTSPE